MIRSFVLILFFWTLGCSSTSKTSHSSKDRRPSSLSYLKNLSFKCLDVLNHFIQKNHHRPFPKIDAALGKNFFKPIDEWGFPEDRQYFLLGGDEFYIPGFTGGARATTFRSIQNDDFETAVIFKKYYGEKRFYGDMEALSLFKELDDSHKAFYIPKIKISDRAPYTYESENIMGKSIMGLLGRNSNLEISDKIQLTRNFNKGLRKLKELLEQNGSGKYLSLVSIGYVGEKPFGEKLLALEGLIKNPTIYGDEEIKISIRSDNVILEESDGLKSLSELRMFLIDPE
ncbi:MAG: hypothetical protein ACPGJV_00570 [Bacteriovoracaceae bacterium]